MTYNEFILFNNRNKDNLLTKFRIEKVLNDNKTCQLVNIDNKNANPMIIDIVHIAAEVRLGRMVITNPSAIKTWKYFNR